MSSITVSRGESTFGEYPLLRITKRCLVEDLGVPANCLSLPVEDIGHEVAQAFALKRAKGGQAGERFVLPKSGPIAEKLRWTERWRGATWYDRRFNVIWLIGAGWHEGGSRADVYKRIAALDEDDRLFPTQEDYEALHKIRAEILVHDILHETVPTLLTEAHLAAPAEVSTVIGGTIPVSIAVEGVDSQYEVIWTAISHRRLAGEFDPPPGFLGMLLAAIYRGTDDPLQCTEDRFYNRPMRSDEWVFACLVERSLYGGYAREAE